MGIGIRIKQAREAIGLTQKQLAQQLGITPSAVTNYENEVSHPKEPILYKLLDTLKVDANFLFQDEMSAHRSAPTPAGQRIGIAYDKAAPPVKETVEVALKPWLDGNSLTIKTKTPPAEEPEADESETMELPQYELSSAAGLGTYMDEVPSYEMRDVLLADVPEGAEMLIRISGDSMEPEYYDGDIVFVESAIALESGDIGIFVVDGFAYCKQLVITGHRRAVLRSMNENYEDIDLSQYAYCHTVGRVIGKLEGN